MKVFVRKNIQIETGRGLVGENRVSEEVALPLALELCITSLEAEVPLTANVGMSALY